MIDYTKIDLPVLIDYLLKNGWVKEPFGRLEVMKFSSPKKEWGHTEALIPAKRELIDGYCELKRMKKGKST